MTSIDIIPLRNYSLSYSVYLTGDKVRCFSCFGILFQGQGHDICTSRLKEGPLGWVLEVLSPKPKADGAKVSHHLHPNLYWTRFICPDISDKCIQAHVFPISAKRKHFSVDEIFIWKHASHA